VDVLARLDLGSPSVVLRRARAADVPAIVGLLADDRLGAGRDGVRTAADLEVYQRAFGLIDSDPAHVLVVAEAGGAAAGLRAGAADDGQVAGGRAEVLRGAGLRGVA
jgi:hypothetical protein